MRNLLYKLSAVALVAVPCAAARADLVLGSPFIVVIGGAGLGSQNTILTIQNSPTEAGAVCRSGATDVIGTTVSLAGVCSGTGSDVKTGNSQTQTRTLAETGVTAASNFGIIFNAVEPSGDAITLNTLVATFYNAAGVAVYQASITQAYTFNQTFTGTGNAGQLFVLSAAQQTAATAAGAFSSSSNRIGLAGSASNSAGGNETFFIANTGLATVTPEPSTTVLMATGLFGLVGVVRRRRQS